MCILKDDMILWCVLDFVLVLFCVNKCHDCHDRSASSVLFSCSD